MMKIVASLIILGLCVNVCYSSAVPASSAQSSALSGLNSTATKVFTASNSTDATTWNPYSATVSTGGVQYSNVVFGPGATNDTSYVYGIVTATNALSKIYKRTINNTVVGWGNDTSEASVAAQDSTVSASSPAVSHTTAVGPGYLAILSTGSDTSSNPQIYVNIVSGSSTNAVTITKIANTASTTAGTSAGTACTTNTLSIGNIWYDIGAAAFFFTYSQNAKTITMTSTSETCASPTSTATAYVNTVNLGGLYVNGTAFFTTNPISATVTPTTASVIPGSVMGGGDNWLNATNIYIVWKDVPTSATTSTPSSIMYSKTTKAAATTAVASFSTLVKDTYATAAGASTQYTFTYTVESIWSSNFTYGIAVGNATLTTPATTASSTTPTTAYTITNFLNGTTTGTDSGLSLGSNTGVNGYWGWQLTTGYTSVASWIPSSGSGATYTWGTFYGNGTVNATQATLASNLLGPVSFYEDVNGTQWVGWVDVDTANAGMVYAGYLAKLQGQLNVASGASILSAITAFFALFLAAIFIF